MILRMLLITNIFLFTSLTVRPILASTFIGNGGQVGDVELEVTLKQIRLTLKDLSRELLDNPDLEVCKCPEDLSDHALCEPIKKLTKEEKKFCSQLVRAQVPEIVKQMKNIKYEWVHDDLSVSENSRIRAADALSKRDENKTYIQQNRFLSITPSKRMFLITHETFHFTRWKNVYIDDDQTLIGNLEARDVINAAAAGITLYSIDQEIFQQFQPLLKISRTNRRHWFSIITPTNTLSSSEKSVYSQENANNARFSYRFQFSPELPFGITVHAQNESLNKSILSSISANERRTRFGFGLTYRWFPFKEQDHLGYIAPSHLLVELLYEKLKGEYSVHDSYTGVDSQASSAGTVLRFNYYIPLNYDFWILFGAHFDNHRLNYSEINLNYDQNSPKFFLGVSYAL